MNRENKKSIRIKKVPLIGRVLSVLGLLFACMWLLMALFNKDMVSAQSGGDFVQGLCGQTITESVILTEDIGPCIGNGIIINGHGITLDGDGYKILGSGSGNGVIVKGKKNVTIKNLFIQDFEKGIVAQNASGTSISMNRMNKNGVGIFLLRAKNASVTNNVVAENSVGICATSSSNKIFHNLIINNQIQIEDAGGNIWEDPVHHFGNFWGNYWGVDDGSNGRTAGDFIGDTLLPHEGVDFSPVLNGSKIRPFLCGDWWLTGVTWWLCWRGGWSPVEIQVTDPHGRTISRDENQIGIDAFYVEDNSIDPTSTLAQIIIVPCGNISLDGVYSFEMTGLEDLTYSMTSFVGVEGEVIFQNSILDGMLAEGETQDIDTRLEETDTGEFIVHLVVSIDIKPGSYPNTINLGSEGVVPVAIFSTPTFDATTIDPATITLTSPTAEPNDQGTPVASFEDVNGDGLLDIVVHIDTMYIELSVTDTEAILEGETSNGVPIRGVDTVKVIE